MSLGPKSNFIPVVYAGTKKKKKKKRKRKKSILTNNGNTRRHKHDEKIYARRTST